MKQMVKNCLFFVLALMLVFVSNTTIAEWDDPKPSETPFEKPSEIPSEKPSEKPFETPSEIPLETQYPTPEVTEASDPDPTAEIEGEQQSDPDEPMAEELEEETIDPSVEVPPVEELPVIERSVTVRRVLPDIVHDGDPFQIEATLVGFDGLEYELQWQYNDGAGWQDVPDAKGSTTLELIADRDNVNYGWRILITIIQEMIMETTSIE